MRSRRFNRTVCRRSPVICMLCSLFSQLCSLFTRVDSGESVSLSLSLSSLCFSLVAVAHWWVRKRKKVFWEKKRKSDPTERPNTNLDDQLRHTTAKINILYTPLSYSDITTHSSAHLIHPPPPPPPSPLTLASRRVHSSSHHPPPVLHPQSHRPKAAYISSCHPSLPPRVASLPRLLQRCRSN